MRVASEALDDRPVAALEVEVRLQPRLVEEAERARTNPGSALLVELFRLSGPAVILLDEVVAYARQLPDDRFEAQRLKPL